jgi:hypothetical protein
MIDRPQSSGIATIAFVSVIAGFATLLLTALVVFISVALSTEAEDNSKYLHTQEAAIQVTEKAEEYYAKNATYSTFDQLKDSIGELDVIIDPAETYDEGSIVYIRCRDSFGAKVYAWDSRSDQYWSRGLGDISRCS